MIPAPAPVQSGATARHPGLEPQEPLLGGGNSSALEAPKVKRGGRRASAGASPKDVTPLRSPDPGEPASPIQGQRTPSTPFSAHEGMAIHSAPRISGLSGEHSAQGRGSARLEIANGDSPYLPRAITTSSAKQRGRNAQSPEARVRHLAHEGSPQQGEFVSPTGKVPRPTQESRRRTQLSQDSGARHGSAPVQTRREQRKSLPQPAGTLDSLWDTLAATIGALPGVAPQTTDNMSRALKSGSDSKSVRRSFDSTLREILAAKNSAHGTGTEASPFPPDLLAWPPSPPLEEASPQQSPMASPEQPCLPATPAARSAALALSPDPRSPLSSEVLDFARRRFNTIKEGPFSRPLESEPLGVGVDVPGDDSADSDSDGEAPRHLPPIRASFTVIPSTNRNISAMSSPKPVTPLITSDRQLAASFGNSSMSNAGVHPLSPVSRVKASSPASGHGRSKLRRHQSSGARSSVSPNRPRQVAFEPELKLSRSPMSPPAWSVHRASNSSASPRLVSPGTPRSSRTSPEAGRSSAVRRSSSPEMASFRQGRSVAMLAHWTGLMSALKLNSIFRTQAVADALAGFCTILESGQAGQEALNAAFGQILQAIKNSQPGFKLMPEGTPTGKTREISSPLRDARSDMGGRFGGIQDGNVSLHLRKLAGAIDSLAARPQLENRTEFRQSAQSLIQWIKNQ